MTANTNEPHARGWTIATAALCGAALLAGCDRSGDGAAAAVATPRTSIEQMYSLPSIIGTSPEGYAWSADGKQLAFLWNDGGLRFRDIWVHSLESGEKRQLTHLVDDRPRDSEHGGISELAWLGDGATLLYVLDGRLHRLDAQGRSASIEPQRERVRNLQLAPGGRRIAFIADGGLWAMEAGAPARRVSGKAVERINVDRYEWSADGSKLAFMELDDREVGQVEIHYSTGGENRTYRTTRPFPGEPVSKVRIGIVDAGAAQPRFIDIPAAAEEVWGFGLSSDASRLFLDTSDFLIKERTVYVYDLAKGTRETCYVSKDPTRVIPLWSAAWAPGDEGLILVSDEDQYFHLYHVAAAGREPRRLTGGPWEVASFKVDHSGRAIYFLANEASFAELQVYRVPFAGGDPERLTQSAGTHAPIYAPDFSRAADRYSNDTTPPDLYLAELKSGAEPVRITTSPAPELAKIVLAKASYIEFKSHVDGTTIHGRLMQPTDFDAKRKYPLLMGSLYRNTVRNRWGGGNEIPTWGLDQVLADRGYVLLKVDTRGGWGAGSGARKALHGRYGGIDIEDVESGVKHMVSLGYVDEKRVGIWGWSYGGLMTLMSMFRKPGLYAAGIADAPASNVAHAFPRQMWVMGPAKGDDFPARYDMQSALNFTDGLAKPLMITHASKDETVLYADTVALSERLIAGGKLFEIVTLPGSTHIWAKDSLAQQKFGYRKMIEFFDRHLQPAGTAR